MELDKAIRERRSIRKYTDKKVDGKTIELIIESGMWAPSACNLQKWKFIVIDDEKLLQQFIKLGSASFIKSVHQAILIVYNNQTDNIEYNDHIQSASACIQNMLLTAHSLHIGTCWINNLPNKKQLRKLLYIPDVYDPIALVTLGYYEQKTNDRPRKYQIKDVVSYNTFQFEDVAEKMQIFLHLKRMARKIYKLLPLKKFWIRIIGKMERKFDN